MPTYRQAGVDIEAAARLVDEVAPAITGTWGSEVVGTFGGFAAGVVIPDGYTRPVLMMSTDGVGTKLDIARRADRWEGVGFDLVAMCVDDLAAVGALPIGFTDYLAVGKLRPQRDRTIIESVAEACGAAGCPLLGGETAEHPGVVEPDHVDLAGAALGVVESGGEVTGAAIRAGDAMVGIHSPNLRANGFSLVRRVLADVDLEDPFPGDSRPAGEVLLEPSVIYSPAVAAGLLTGEVHGLAHITGGGLPGNVVRVLPEECEARLAWGSWEVPAVFRTVQRLGKLPDEEMMATFNLGIGYVVIVPPEGVDRVRDTFRSYGHASSVIGEIGPGRRGFSIR